MQYFPVFMDLKNQPVLVVGAGAVAERKVRLLMKAGAVVQIVAQDLNHQFEQWLELGEIQHVAKEYDVSALEKARLVFAATSDAQLNQRVFDDAESRLIPVNVVDDQKKCRFISPAVVDRSPVLVAISTGGSSPVLARRIRSRVESLLPMGLGKVAQAAQSLRGWMKTNVSHQNRRQLWERLLSDNNLNFWSLQSKGKIRSQMQQLLNQDANKLENTVGQTGRVYLVGAGPGRADLLTLRALNVMGKADVILHDGLVSSEVLDLARRDADRVNVGKRAARHHGNQARWTQQDIQRLMVKEARSGRTVVRLKGGDSFVFGRGGEELEYLREHEIEYEVVPGISAALGCAAFSGIPLTHRDHARMLSFVTGHVASRNLNSNEFAGAEIDWKNLVGQDRTAVVYMGVRQAAPIRKQMIMAGVASNMPAALIIDGTLDSQQVIHGCVEKLPEMAAQVGSGRPGLLIIGQVAALGSTLAWFDKKIELKSAA